MSKGILLFAFNNSEIDYIKIAEYAATQAKKFLNAPVSLVTDSDSAAGVSEGIFDHIIIDKPKNYTVRLFRDGEKEVSKTVWKNTHRSSAYELTPYDETLVLDVDYIVNSPMLNYCWDQPNEFLIYKDSFDLSQCRISPKYISELGPKFYWATVFYFKKTESVKSLFSIVEHIRDNWEYYKFLYQIDSFLFRNDFAFSIAIHMLNGFTEGDFAKALPGKLYYTLDRDYFVKQKDRSFYFLVQNETGNHIPLKMSNVDIHIMNKYSLIRTVTNE